MDARTQRRLKREKTREKILKKEAEEKQKKKRETTNSTSGVLCASEPKSDSQYIQDTTKRLKKLEFTYDEKWQLTAWKTHTDQTKRNIFYKIIGNSLFTKELKRHNDVLIRRCANYRREIVDLKKRLKQSNDELCEWKKWITTDE